MNLRTQTIIANIEERQRRLAELEDEIGAAARGRSLRGLSFMALCRSAIVGLIGIKKPAFFSFSIMGKKI